MFKEGNIENDFFTKMNFHFDAKSLKAGAVLISEPFLKDPNFARTVIVLTHYSKEDGAVGFVLNRPTLPLSQVLSSITDLDHFVYEGGPVDENMLFYLYTDHPLLPKPQQKIQSKLYFSSDIQSVIPLINRGELDEKFIRFFAGYSGWAVGQLEQELAENTWIVGSLTWQQILRMDYFEVWRKALERLGPKYKVMTNFPIDPSLN